MPFARTRSVPAVLLATLAIVASSHGKRPDRFGFQGMGALYRGGYAITTAETSLAGPATARIHRSPDGRSATVTWKNTFYDERGKQERAVRWNFRPDGIVVVSTLDPRVAGLSGTGTFVLRGRSPVDFTARGNLSPATTITGRIRLIGGGSLSVIVTLKGLAEGDVTYSFSGTRVR